MRAERQVRGHACLPPTMVAMKTAPPSLRPALCYVAFAVALSWSYWGLLLALGLRVDAAGVGAHPGVTHLPGLLGPAVAAILTARWYGGPGAGWALLRRAFTRWPRPAFRGWLLALSPLIAGALLAVGAAAALGAATGAGATGTVSFDDADDADDKKQTFFL